MCNYADGVLVVAGAEHEINPLALKTSILKRRERALELPPDLYNGSRLILVYLNGSSIHRSGFNTDTFVDRNSVTRFLFR